MTQKAYWKMSQEKLLIEYNTLMSSAMMVVNNMAKRIKPQKFSAHPDDTYLRADGFDDAIIGFGNQTPQEKVLIYDAEKCIDILMKRDGMTGEDALEYFCYNVEGAYMGEHTPIFMWNASKEDLEIL